jgi:probable FeS assembly SUF system protein SufT
MMRRYATLKRECAAVEIPAGMPVTLPEGSPVTITQALGGSYTALTAQGYMVRIDGKDADALGEEFEAEVRAEQTSTEGKPLQEMVWDQLRTCYDPEIPVNIVDLGLVYSCDLEPLPDGDSRVSVRFTLTAPGCGMGDYLQEDIKQKLLNVRGIKEVDVQVQFDPPWSYAMMSEAARLQLGLM